MLSELFIITELMKRRAPADAPELECPVGCGFQPRALLPQFWPPPQTPSRLPTPVGSPCSAGCERSPSPLTKMNSLFPDISSFASPKLEETKDPKMPQSYSPKTMLLMTYPRSITIEGRLSYLAIFAQ